MNGEVDMNSYANLMFVESQMHKHILISICCFGTIAFNIVSTEVLLSLRYYTNTLWFPTNTKST